MGSAHSIVTEGLAAAGITIGGSKPQDIVVHDERLYHRILAQGFLGLGEAYMDGWWDANALDVFTDACLRHGIDSSFRTSPALVWHHLKARVLNRQTRRRSRQVGREHYDKGNDLFVAMLDEHMQYSCAYWKGARTLQQAQDAKLDLIARKLRLKKGMRVLDIGCGWGGLAAYIARRHGVSVVGVTISEQQASLARERTEGLDVEIRLQDYRELAESFDRVVSVGMFEHVGHRNYAEYLDCARRCLPRDGIFVLHSIGANVTSRSVNAWTDKYIFPNGELPSVKAIADALEGRFILEDWHCFGPDYDKTLLAWHRNFTKAWPRLEDSYDERFRRMWEFYLLTSAGGFRARHLQLWQLVLSPGGVDGRYDAPR